MKGKICGLLSALFITLGLSLSINLNDSSALKYSYNAFPVIQKVLTAGSSTAPNGISKTFSITFDSTLTSNVSAPEGVMEYKQRQSNGNCINLGTSGIFGVGSIQDRNQIYVNSGSGRAGHYRYFNVRPPLSSDYSSASSFLTDSMNCHNSGTYDYDSLYGGTIDISTGDYDKFIDISRVYGGFRSGGLKMIQVPLDISQSNVGTISSGTPLSWTFEIFSLSPLQNISSSPDIDFDLTYFPNNFDTWSGTVSDFGSSRISASASCTYDPNHEFLKVNDDLTFSHMYGYKVDCSYTAPTDMSNILATLSISGDSSVNPVNIFTFSDYLYFGSSYLVTNNDDTYSGKNANEEPTGDNIEKAPGYSSLYCDNAATCDPPGDGMFGLTELFNFTFMNPFEPILHLFTDNGSCVQIPTIAGMIHSEETQVCPWFDSNVRNIVTPVLGLSSMMLVFGFAVRWLGARSGNMFEDSFEGSSGGISIGTKGRSK